MLTSTSASNSYGLSSAQQETLADIIADCDCMTTVTKRDGVVQLLEFRKHIKSSDTPTEHALYIVQACCMRQRGIDALMDAMAVFDAETFALTAVHEHLQELLYQPVTWAEAAQLKLLLKRAALPDSEARVVLGEMAGLDSLSLGGCPPTTLFMCLLDILAKQPIMAPASAPLLEFLERSRARMAADRYDSDALRLWIEPIAEREKISLAALRDAIASAPEPVPQPAARALPGETVLIVELMPKKVQRARNRPGTSIAALDDYPYFVQVWLYRRGKTDNIYTSDRALPLDQIGAKFHMRLREARERIGADAMSDLIIEFLLPTGLLHFPVQEWKRSEEDDEQIGAWYRVVVRSSDRVRRGMDDGRARHRWGENRIDLEPQESWVKPYEDTKVFLEEWQSLITVTDVLCLTLGAAPPEDVETRQKLFRCLVKLGMPIAIWPSGTAGKPECQETLRSLFKTKPLRLLPLKVQAAWTKGCRCTLLWDNPWLVLPEPPGSSVDRPAMRPPVFRSE
jgi:hypothetical protein